jgi:hypothetical protein
MLKAVCKDTVPIAKEHLKSLNQPVARVDAQFSSSRSKNHAKKELSLPLCAALSVSAKVMLLTNFVVEEHLFNGAFVESVIDIVCKDPEGPRKPGNQPACVVVDFPKCKMLAKDAWDSANPTHVPIPRVEFRCEKKCCSMKQVPSKVCKAAATHKCQGRAVGPGQVWEKLIVKLPTASSRAGHTPGLAQVAFSRTSELENLAILSDPTSPLTLEQIQRIGIGKACDKLRLFEQQLWESQDSRNPKSSC